MAKECLTSSSLYIISSVLRAMRSKRSNRRNLAMLSRVSSTPFSGVCIVNSTEIRMTRSKASALPSSSWSFFMASRTRAHSILASGHRSSMAASKSLCYRHDKCISEQERSLCCRAAMVHNPSTHLHCRLWLDKPLRKFVAAEWALKSRDFHARFGLELGGTRQTRAVCARCLERL